MLRSFPLAILAALTTHGILLNIVRVIHTLVRALTLALPLTAVAMPAEAAFAAKKDATCKLKSPLAVKPVKGKKKIPPIAKGESVKLLEVKGSAVTIEWKRDKWLTSTGDLDKHCDAPPPPAPATPPPTAVAAAPQPAPAASPPPPPAPIAETPPAATPAPQPATPPPSAATPAPSAAAADVEIGAGAPVVSAEPGKPSAAPGSKTRITLGALSMPPGSSPAVADSIRELIQDLISQPASLEWVAPPSKLTAQEKDAACAQSDACAAGVGKKVNAQYAIAAVVTVKDAGNALAFRLVDVQSGKVVKQAARVAKDPASLPDEVFDGAYLLVRDMIPEDYARLTVSANEDGATLKVDGTAAGTTPAQPYRVAAGEHEVVLEKPNFIPTKQLVAIDPGRDARVTLWLEPTPEFKESYVSRAKAFRALAWTGLGLGIAGAVATFSLRVAANVIYDDLDRQFTALDARNAPEADYAPLNERAQIIPVLDGLTWAAGAVAIVGAATAVTFFIVGNDPKRYDRPKKVDDERVGKNDSDFHMAVGLAPRGFGLGLSGGW